MHQLYLFLMNFTAGFGAFAGRALKTDEIVFRTWITLFLPRSFPQRQILQWYVFNHNKTHMALDLDYGSIINHYEHANARGVGVTNMHYRLRGFPRMHMYMHT